jgi:hypothetical protein
MRQLPLRLQLLEQPCKPAATLCSTSYVSCTPAWGLLPALSGSGRGAALEGLLLRA